MMRYHVGSVYEAAKRGDDVLVKTGQGLVRYSAGADLLVGSDAFMGEDEKIWPTAKDTLGYDTITINGQKYGMNEFCVDRPEPSPPREPAKPAEATLPKWRIVESVPIRDGAEIVVQALGPYPITSLWSAGERLISKDLAIVPWEWAVEKQERESLPLDGFVEKINFSAIPTMLVSDLARAVNLAPGATREQVMGRIEALMREPRALLEADRSDRLDLCRRVDFSRNKLEAVINDLEQERTENDQLRGLLADAQLQIDNLKRRQR